MKNLKQKLIDIFFGIDFTTAINEGLKNYGLSKEELSNKEQSQNTQENTNLKDFDTSD